MGRKVAYWGSTAIAAFALLGSLSYLTGNEQVVSGFAKAGYPQHLRIVLGFAKPAAAIVLLIPGLALLKEWVNGEQIWPVPLVLLAVLAVSYATRPPSRRLAG
jgi:DoxX-like family